ncbi:MAG: mycothione reductase [Actinomycetota bacterium]|nr:mycothione reductase [Actinomycetota bacterium]
MQNFSLAIIGSGSGNVVVPDDPAQGPVAVIESGAFGGTCINRGCIPSKILVYTAEVAAQVRHAPEFGLGAVLTEVDWPAIRDRTFARVDRTSAAGRRARAESDQVTLFERRARFAGPHELVMDDNVRISADRIVLATGARPVVPPVIADSGVGFHTSDTIMRIDELPARMVIVGGGYVAAEFAHVFSSLGVGISVVALAPRLLEALDPEISERFTALARKRWDVHLSATITEVRRGGDGVAVLLEDGTTVTGDLLLVAAGRKPDTGDLSLDLAGVKRRDDGRIQVDEYGRTTAEGIWSLGDASSPFELKHVANAEARTLAHNLAHPDDLRPYPHDWVPAAVFTEPQIATVGARRQDLAGKRPYVEAIQAYADTAYGWARQDSTGICKLYADPATGKLLGAHILGYQASLLIQPLIQGASLGQRVADLARGQYWIHPALMEVVENALLKLPLPSEFRPR